MNQLIISCLIIAAISVGYGSTLRVKRQAQSAFHGVDIEKYLKNERAVRFQLKCIIDGAPCDRIGKYLKIRIPELLETHCSNCDTEQRERARKLVTHIEKNFPEEWEKAVRKFQGDKLVSVEDAAKLKEILGIQLHPKFIEPATAASAASTPAPKPPTVSTTSVNSSPAVASSS